jgi:hypothetical protein
LTTCGALLIEPGRTHRAEGLKEAVRKGCPTTREPCAHQAARTTTSTACGIVVGLPGVGFRPADDVQEGLQHFDSHAVRGAAVATQALGSACSAARHPTRTIVGRPNDPQIASSSSPAGGSAATESERHPGAIVWSSIRVAWSSPLSTKRSSSSSEMMSAFRHALVPCQSCSRPHRAGSQHRLGLRFARSSRLPTRAPLGVNPSSYEAVSSPHAREPRRRPRKSRTSGHREV